VLDKLKSIAKDAVWLSIGTVATVGYVSYKAGKSIVNDVPEMMEFAQDTYSQVKSVITKKSKGMPFAGDYDNYSDYCNAVKDAGFTMKDAGDYEKDKEHFMHRTAT